MSPATLRLLRGATLLLLVGWVPPGVAPASALDDPEHRHALDELALRDGPKPYERMIGADGRYPSERTVLDDAATGATLWRLTHERRNDRHVYYDVPAWSLDGSRLLMMHGSGLVDRYWVLPADGSSLRPLAEGTGSDLPLDEISDEGFSGEVFWSWLFPDQLYSLRKGMVRQVAADTGSKVDLFDLAAATGLTPDGFRVQPPHPLDDRLLFSTRDTGRIFSLDLTSLELGEFPGDGRWAVADGLHRLRWTKDGTHGMFIGQNSVLEDGQAILAPVQYLAWMDGTLLDCVTEGFDQRGGHPDAFPGGDWLTGSHDGEIWRTDCPGGALDRQIYDAPTFHHASVTWDGRWLISDNSPASSGRPMPFLRGRSVEDSLTLVSLDGRAQTVLTYPYASYAQDENAHPAPVTSPDGTKVLFDSDLLERGEFLGDAAGNADVWMAVVRPPAPPRAVSAQPEAGGVRLSWSRPLHGEQSVYWNPGNLSLEISGYFVWRAQTSGGPFSLLFPDPIPATEWLDVTAQPGRSYFYVVQSAEPSGLVSLFSPEVHGRLDGGPPDRPFRLYAEVEHGSIGLPAVPQFEAGASGAWFVGTFAAEPDPAFPVEPLPGKIDLTLQAPAAGGAYLWLRALADGAGGAVRVVLDGATFGTVDVAPGPWSWVAAGGPIDVASGAHSVALRLLDPEVGVDQVLFTNDANLVPVGPGPVDSVAPAPPDSGEIVVVDETTRTVSWQPSTAPDFAHYNVYCGRDDGYPVDNRRLLLSPVEPVAWDWGIPAGLDTVYKVTVVDRQGNESEPLVLDPLVIGTGAAPVAVADALVVDEDQVLDLAAPGVLGNDIPADGQALEAILLSGPESGDLTLEADGSVVYVPAPDVHGTFTFRYKASDGRSDSAGVDVTLEVVSVNDAPVAMSDAYEGSEDTKIDIRQGSGLLANDSDVEGDLLVAELVSPPVFGSLTVEADGAFLYQPDPDFFGADSFTYLASDGVDVSPATRVDLTVAAVDDPPKALNDEYTVAEDQKLRVKAPGVLSNDEDVDPEGLTVEVASPPSSGRLQLRSDGAVVYLPNRDFVGTDSFSYRALDGLGGVDEAAVQILVTAVNDAPVAASDAYAATEDARLDVGFTSGVLANDSDVDGDYLTVAAVTLPAHGSLALDPRGSFTYTPDPDFAGSDLFTYEADDGLVKSAAATVTIAVAAVNDKPQVVDDAWSVDEDTPLSVAAPGVLGNDSDADGDPLQVSLVDAPTLGVLSLAADGSFLYEPFPNTNGSDTFTYQATDGQAVSQTARVAVTVVAVPDAPVALPDGWSVPAGGLLEVAHLDGVLANDSDADGESLSAVLVSDVGSGTLVLGPKGAVTYRPDPGFVGLDRFVYRASDGLLTSADVQVVLTVLP